MKKKQNNKNPINKLLIAIFILVSILGTITFYAIYMLYRCGTELRECLTLLQSCYP